MDETQGRIVECVRTGKPLTEAAREAGTSINNVKRWLTKGKQEPAGRYGEFFRAVEAARLAVPEQTTGQRYAEIEALAGSVGHDASSRALLGLARALASKIDWCERTPSGVAAMALGSLASRYREIITEIAPPSTTDQKWLADLLTADHDSDYRRLLERIAAGDLSGQAAADAARQEIAAADQQDASMSQRYGEPVELA